MAEASDPKPTTLSYSLMGGIDQKASEYSVDKARFLDIRNMDFDVPNALQKRPGQTQAIGQNTSGPINSVWEYIRLDGNSYIVAGTDTAMFYRTGTSLTVLDTGWNNGQPADMLTFVNNLYMANGQNYKYWNGTTLTRMGLPTSTTSQLYAGRTGPTVGATNMLVGGASMAMQIGSSWVARAVFVAYNYVRSDGYAGPLNLLNTAKNIVRADVTDGAEFFNTYSKVYGFTIPTNYEISSLNLWVGVDTVRANGNTAALLIAGFSAPTVVRVGSLAYQDGLVVGSNRRYASASLIPNADLSRFWLYQSLPGTSLFLEAALNGVTQWGTTFQLVDFSAYDGAASGEAAFSGMAFDFFSSYTPKYIEVNQNTMFMGGFSSAPSSVWFSEVAQPEVILSAENNFEVRTNDGDRVLALKSYNNQLIILKENSFSKVIGDSADNYELVELSTEYGCLSNQAIIEYKEKLLWLDKKGIVEYNGASWDIISTGVEDIFRRINLTAAREKAVAIHQVYRNQVWFGIPVDGSTQNNITVVYDYIVNAWTFFDGFNPASFGMIKGPLDRPTVWTGNYSGMLSYFSESFYGDNGSGITCLARSAYDKNAENETWIWRRLFFDVNTVSGITGVMNGRVYSNYNNSTVQATFRIFQDQFQSRAEMGVVAKACSFEFSHSSASLPLLFNGYTWARRYLRNL